MTIFLLFALQEKMKFWNLYVIKNSEAEYVLNKETIKYINSVKYNRT